MPLFMDEHSRRNRSPRSPWARGRRDGRGHRGLLSGRRPPPGDIEKLVSLLREHVPGVFNQYRLVDPDFDQPDASARRLANLRAYLRLFAQPRYVLIGEAAGHAGCRFSGVPFTDEAQLVGLAPLAWAGARSGFRRSSREDRPLPRELSARVVWGSLAGRRDVALWNVVPWHPQGSRGPLSNGSPSRASRAAGLEVLRFVLDVIWPRAEPRAVGRLAEHALCALGMSDPIYLRHPSQGGAAVFRRGVEEFCRQE